MMSFIASCIYMFLFNISTLLYLSMQFLHSLLHVQHSARSALLHRLYEPRRFSNPFLRLRRRRTRLPRSSPSLPSRPHSPLLASSSSMRRAETMANIQTKPSPRPHASLSFGFSGQANGIPVRESVPRWSPHVTQSRDGVTGP